MNEEINTRSNTNPSGSSHANSIMPSVSETVHDVFVALKSELLELTAHTQKINYYNKCIKDIESSSIYI